MTEAWSRCNCIVATDNMDITDRLIERCRRWARDNREWYRARPELGKALRRGSPQTMYFAGDAGVEHGQPQLNCSDSCSWTMGGEYEPSAAWTASIPAGYPGSTGRTDNDVPGGADDVQGGCPTQGTTNPTTTTATSTTGDDGWWHDGHGRGPADGRHWWIWFFARRRDGWRCQAERVTTRGTAGGAGGEAGDDATGAAAPAGAAAAGGAEPVPVECRPRTGTPFFS